MNTSSAVKVVQVLAETGGPSPSKVPEHLPDSPARDERSTENHPVFHAVWLAMNAVLIIMILLTACSLFWEYSTRRYLKGFSDAVVPAASTPEVKVEAILNWMANGPARLPSDESAFSMDRDPTDTLNYTALLQVCGSATNAFVNLADSAGLTARRLLLLDPRNLTKHVVAEVLIGGRWVVVDPAYRMMLREPNGGLLTREELRDPRVLLAATTSIYGYNQDYTYDTTAHIRLSRLGLVGRLLRRVLDRWAPGWEDSATMTLLVERESFFALAASIILVMLLILVRFFLRWYGEQRLGVVPARIRTRMLRACTVLLTSPK